ncbi:hypothetical protein LINPERHAP1_LOCUS14612, partial [Linum perenne]
MLVWPLEASGCFSVRSLTKALIKERFDGCLDFPTEVVWARYVPTKVSCLVWKVAHERLATIDILRQRGVGGNQIRVSVLSWVGGSNNRCFLGCLL